MCSLVYLGMFKAAVINWDDINTKSLPCIHSIEYSFLPLTIPLQSENKIKHFFLLCITSVRVISLIKTKFKRIPLPESKYRSHVIKLSKRKIRNENNEDCRYLKGILVLLSPAWSTHQCIICPLNVPHCQACWQSISLHLNSTYRNHIELLKNE